jgi:RHS repeat-associated protein
MPVSLSYHTGGIKVAENASWCGLGWSLQAGGMVTRVVQGVPDDENIRLGFYHYGNQLSTPLTDLQIVDIGIGNRDGEADVFTVNFNGNSGKFYFDKDKICRFVERRDWIVMPIIESFEFKGFVITTEDGTRYHFGKVQGSTNFPLVERSGVFNSVAQEFTTTSWYLVKVESHDFKDVINLSYIAELYEYKQANYCREFQVISGCANAIQINNQCVGTPKNTVMQQGWRLSSISNISGTQTINFIANTLRQDLPLKLFYGSRGSVYGGMVGEDAKRLDQIQIVSGTYTINHILEYDYIYDGPSLVQTTDVANSRLRLLRVKKQKGTVDDQIYSFEYLNNLGAGKETFFPTTQSKQIDHWGYYNGATGNDNLNLLAPPTRVYNDAATYYRDAGQANRESNETTMKHGSLRRINFPTGGYTEFTMEANKHTSLETTISNNQVFFVNAGYGYSECPIPLTAEKCWAPLNAAASTHTYKITFSNSFASGSCSASTPSGTIQFIDETTLLTVATVNLPAANPEGALNTIFNFDPLKRYRVVINVSNANLCVFEIKKLVSQTALTTRAVGGLRVQQVTNYDPVSQVSNSKTYTYVSVNGGTSSSGFLFSVPKYGHYIANPHLAGAMFWSGSVTPMSNYQGFHIGYTRVEEKVVGAIGKTVYTFNAVKEFTNPGESYASSNDPYPIVPKMPNFANGTMNTSTQLSEAGATVASSMNTGASFIQPVLGQLFYKMYFIGEVVPAVTQSNPDCTNLPFGIIPATTKEMYKISTYTANVGYYRLASKIEVLDNVSTTTTYKYDGSYRHLMSTGTKVTNSDGKEYESTIKYVHDYVGGELATTATTPNPVLITTDLVNNLKSRNIIAIPIETKSTVKTGTTTITTGGQRMQFSFFDALGAPTTTVGTNPIYIYKSYAYETPRDNTAYSEAKWQLKATITKYNAAFGKPELYLSDGWLVSEKYTYHPTNRLVSKKEFLGATTGLTWDYEYIANTKLLSKYTDENRLVKTFTYDPMMRLQILKDRMKADGTDVQATTTYDYHYKGQPTTNAVDLNSNFVGTSTIFVNATNTTPLSSKQYVDGLGRPISTVRETYTPSLGHQKNNVTYDALGRKDKTHLPFENSLLGYESAGATPFAFITYEQSPLSRPLKQTNVNNTGITLFYGGNLGTDNVRKYTYTSVVGSFGTVTNNNVYYTANDLSKTISWDENGTVLLPNVLPVVLPATNIGRVETYKDKLGRTILTRKFLGAQNVDTYNVYDDFGNLVMVIPPSAMDVNGNPISTMVYTYVYDSRNRLSEKKVPNAAAQKFYYNARDLLTLVQDGNMRSATFGAAFGGGPNRYLGTQYNDIGQVVKTGWVTTTTPATTALNVTIADADKVTETQYYLNRTWVKHQGAKVLKPTGATTVREFIWSYIERRAGFEYTGNPIWTGKQHLLSKTYVNGTTLVQNDAPITDNDYGGVNWMVSAYDGAQKPKITYNYLYSGPSTYTAQEVRQAQSFEYDNGQRLKRSKYAYAMNGTAVLATPTFILNDMGYNWKDQMIEKNTAFVNNKYLQSTDYTYNNRGWLTSINSGFLPTTLDYPVFNCTTTPTSVVNSYASLGTSGILTPPAQAGESNPDLFKEIIRYDNPVAAYPGSRPAQRNGNISQIEWQVAGREAQGYSFKYDDLYRMTEANYTDIHASNWSTKGWAAQYEADNKYKEIVTYDIRGNILSMLRTGRTSTSSINGTGGYIMCGTYETTDNMAYTYGDVNNRDRLTKVAEAANISWGFRTVSTTVNATATHYTYDDNGNIIADANKGITNITYNHLNLPLVITFTNNASGQPRRIEFIYDAGGAKLRKTSYENNFVIELRDYSNGIEYVGGVLNRFANTEGAVIRNSNGQYQHEYVIKDHLGNARVTYQDGINNGASSLASYNDGTITTLDIKQIDHYYPFGAKMDGNWNTGVIYGSNRYQYNSKELVSDFNLDWYDYGARYYDAAVARWWGVDLMSEAYNSETPFSYCGNSPMSHIDLGGTFRISDELARTYPSLAGFLQALPQIYKDKPESFKQAVREFSELSDNEILAILDPNSGPEILVEDLDRANGETGLRDRNATSGNKSDLVIRLSKVIANYYSPYNIHGKEGIRAAYLGLESTLFHELTHYGDIIKDGKLTKTSIIRNPKTGAQRAARFPGDGFPGSHEGGKEFEMKAYGSDLDINQLMDALYRKQQDNTRNKKTEVILT